MMSCTSEIKNDFPVMKLYPMGQLLVYAVSETTSLLLFSGASQKQQQQQLETTRPKEITVMSH